MKIYSIHYNNEPNEEKVRNHFTFETISWKCTSSEWVYMHVYICIRLVYFPSQFFSHSVYAYNMCCVGARVCVCQLPMNLQLEINFFVCINCVWNKKKAAECKAKKCHRSGIKCTVHTHTHTLSLVHWVCDTLRKTQMHVWVRWDYLCELLLLWLSIALNCDAFCYCCVRSASYAY